MHDRPVPAADGAQKHGSCKNFQVSRLGEIQGKSGVEASKMPRSREQTYFGQSTKWQRNISPKAVDLVKKVLIMSDVKEEVYKELDKWLAFEQTFPIKHIKQALKVFKREKDWKRVIQISKWMLSKGQGKTIDTYKDLMVALDGQGRMDEAEHIWENKILKSSMSIPNKVVSYALAMLERHNKPIEVIKLFTSMEESGRKLDSYSVIRAAMACKEAGFLEKQQQLLRKYNLFEKEGCENATHKTSECV